VKVGLLFPHGYFNEFEGWTATAAWERILEIARLGFDSLWTGEHVLAKWDREGIMFDCVTLHTAVAAAVPRVDIGFGVINSTFRNPAMTAKLASTLDTISGGRLIVGLGCGFKVSEASAFGVPFPDMKVRLAILGEHFEIISRIPRRDEAPFTFQGVHARVQDVVNNPRTGGGDHVRLAIGGHGKNVTFRLAAKYCDEINVDLPEEDMAEAMAVLADRCGEIGYEAPRPGLASTWEFVIVGSTGIIELDPYGRLRLGRGDGWEVAAEMPSFDPLDASDPIRLRAYARQLEDLVVAAHDGRDPLVSGDEGRRTTAMLTAAEASARSGEAVRIEVD